MKCIVSALVVSIVSARSVTELAADKELLKLSKITDNAKSFQMELSRQGASNFNGYSEEELLAACQMQYRQVKYALKNKYKRKLGPTKLKEYLSKAA